MAENPIFRVDAQTERAVRAFLQRLAGGYSISGARLYGSRASGEHSDADLAVFLSGPQGDLMHTGMIWPASPSMCFSTRMS